MLNTRTLTKVAALSSLIFGAAASSAMAVPLCQAITQKSQEKILVAQSVDEDSNLKFESRGCYRTKTTTVICDVLVTNLSNARQAVLFSANSNMTGLITNAIDASGTVYSAKLAKSGTNESSTAGAFYFTSNIASGIPTKIIFTFEIPQEVTQLSALDVGYVAKVSGNSDKRIALANIGAIASKSNSATTTTGSNNSNCTCPPNSTPPRRKPK